MDQVPLPPPALPPLSLPAAPQLAAALLPFQRAGVEAAIRAGGRMLIADEMARPRVGVRQQETLRSVGACDA
jgi:hypothetical protein